MRLGLCLDPCLDPAEVPDQARGAEDLGYDLLACGEHLFFHGSMANAFIALSAAAAVTERIRLVSSLTILPLYPVAVAAKLASQLDRLSRGRFELGVGVGGEYRAEFAAAGSDVTTRGPRTDEALEVISQLLTGRRVTAEGGFGAITGLRLDPPPVQSPRPPIWVGGRRPAAMRRAGRFADVWMPYMVDVDTFGRSLAQARGFAVDAGRSAESVTGALFVWGSVDEDPMRARAEAIEAVSRTYDQDFGPLANRYLLHGTPQDVVARLGEYATAGAETVLFSPACPAERRADVIASFARQVAPHLRGSGGEATAPALPGSAGRE